MAARGLVNGRDGLQRMSCGHSCLNSRALARRQGPAPKEWEGFSFQTSSTSKKYKLFYESKRSE